jgi:hypothetical protein
MGATTRLGWSRRGPIATVQRIAATVPCRAPGTVATALRRWAGKRRCGQCAGQLAGQGRHGT